MKFIALLARAAVAAGIDGLFAEAHGDPANATSDGMETWMREFAYPVFRFIK